jgi:hypothetical protein
MSKLDLYLILIFFTIWIGIYFWYKSIAAKSESYNKSKVIFYLGFTSAIPSWISSTFSDFLFTKLGIQKVGWIWGSWVIWLILVIAVILIFRNPNVKKTNNDNNSKNQIRQGKDSTATIINDHSHSSNSTHNYYSDVSKPKDSKYQKLYEKLIDLKNLLDEIKYRSDVKSDCPKFQRLLKELRTDLEKSQLTFSTNIINKIENLLLEIDQFTSGTCIGLMTLEDHVAQISDKQYQKIRLKYDEFECFLQNQLPRKLNQLAFAIQLDEYGLTRQAFLILKQFADIGEGELWLRESSNTLAFQIRTTSGSLDVSYSNKSRIQTDLNSLLSAGLINDTKYSGVYVLEQKGIDFVSKMIE